MAALREDGLADAIGVAPGPANGFTLDLLDCFERFGERIDWAMVILNPFEPWPGELVLDAAAERGIGVITRVVDYGGLFWGDVDGGRRLPRARPSPLPARRLGRARARAARREVRPIAERHGLTPMQLACAWNLAHPRRPVRRPDADPGGGRRRPPDRGQACRAGGAPRGRAHASDEVAEIRRIGDNFGSMALKGASPEHEGEVRPDRWPLTPELVAAGERWGVVAERDLVARHDLPA